MNAKRLIAMLLLIAMLCSLVPVHAIEAVGEMLGSSETVDVSESNESAENTEEPVPSESEELPETQETLAPEETLDTEGFGSIEDLAPDGEIQAMTSAEKTFFQKFNIAGVKTAVTNNDTAAAKTALFNYYKDKFVKTYVTKPFNEYTNNLTCKTYCTLPHKNALSFQELYHDSVMVKNATHASYAWYELDMGTDVTGSYVLSTFQRSNDYIYVNSNNTANAPQLVVTFKDGTKTTYYATGDSSVRCGLPNQNYGTNASLRIQHTVSNSKNPGENDYISDLSKTGKYPYGGKSYRSYVRFDDVVGLKNVVSVKMRVYAAVMFDGGKSDTAEFPNGIELSVMRSHLKSWSETAITWQYLVNNVSLGHFSYDGVHNGTTGGFDWVNPLGAPGQFMSDLTRFLDITYLCQRNQTGDIALAKSRMLDFITDFYINTAANDTIPSKHDIEPANRMAEMPYILDVLFTKNMLTADEFYTIMQWIVRETDYLYYDRSGKLFVSNTAEGRNLLSYSNRGIWHLAGLYSACMYFQEFSEAASWKDTFDARMDYVGSKLIAADGSYCEATFSYPSSVVRWLGHIDYVAKSFNDKADGVTVVVDKCIDMVKYLIRCSYPNTYMPYWGDGSAPLVTVAIESLQKITDGNDNPNYQNILWYLDRKHGTPIGNHAEYDGIRVVTDRTGWTADDSMIFMNAVMGANHAHRDCLALLFFYGGRELLADTGMSSYSGAVVSWQANNVDSHNTIEIGGNVGVVDGKAETEGQRDDLTQGIDYSLGDIDLYANEDVSFVRASTTATPNYTHYRNVSFVKELGEFLIVSDYVVPDSSVASKSQVYRQSWHCDPGSNPTIDTSNVSLTGKTAYSSGPNLTIKQAEDASKTIAATLPTGYDQGSTIPTKYFQYTQTKTGSVGFNTVIVPTSSGNANFDVEAINTGCSDDLYTAMKIFMNDSKVGKFTAYYYNSFEAEPGRRTITLTNFKSDANTMETDAQTAFASIDNATNAITMLSMANGKILDIPTVEGNAKATGSISSNKTVANMSVTVEDGIMYVETTDEGILNGYTSVTVTWNTDTTITEVRINGEKYSDVSISGYTATINPVGGLLIHFDDGSVINRYSDGTRPGWVGKKVNNLDINGDLPSHAIGDFQNGDDICNPYLQTRDTTPEDFGNYVLQAGDVVEVRMKIRLRDRDRAVTENFDYFQVDFYNTADVKANVKLKTAASAMDTGYGYQVFRFPAINVAHIGLALNGLQLSWVSESKANVQGSFFVDYIYIGPEKNAPSNAADYLFFGFTNQTSDKTRYRSLNYSNVQFDADKNYWYSNVTETLSNANEGTMSLAVTSGKSVVYTETGANSTTNPLSYLPQRGDMLQIRIRFENCKPLTTEDPRLKFYYKTTSDQPSAQNGAELYIDPEDIKDGEYHTYTVSAPHWMTVEETITALRAQIYGLDTSYGGKVVIDYIYLGQEEYLPRAIMDDVPYLPSNSFEDFSEENTGSDTINFPNNGAIRIEKEAYSDGFTGTGVAQVELTAAGTAIPKGQDVVFLLDVSSSMVFSREDLGKDTTRYYDAIEMIDDMSRDLLADKAEDSINTVSLVFFGGLDTNRNSGKGSAYYGNVDERGYPLIDSVMVVLDRNGGYNDVHGRLWATRYTSRQYLKKLANGTYETVTDDEGNTFNKVYGEPYLKIRNPNGSGFIEGVTRGGTNYDYGFKEAYDLIDDIKKDNGSADRDIVLVFITDGLPTVYSDYGQKHGGSWTGDYMADENTLLPVMTDKTWREHLLGTDNDYAYDIAQLVDRFEVVMHDMDIDEMKEMGMEYDDAVAFLKSMVAGKELPVHMADNRLELRKFKNDLVGELKAAGTFSQVFDTVGEQYNLQMASQSGTGGEGRGLIAITPPTIDVKRYAINTNGDRTGDATIIEQVTFNDEGTAAYSSILGADKNIMKTVNGITTIKAVYFTYTKDNATSEEKFTWRIGKIDGYDYALTYWVYLINTMEGKRPGGVYPTNVGATLNYVDIYDKYISAEYPIPELPWGGAITTPQYYLVNENGEPINKYGTVVPFANRVPVGKAPGIELKWNESTTVKGIDYVPAGYVMFNPNASYAVTPGSNNVGNKFNITDIATKTTYRVDAAETDLSNTSNTKVAFGVVSESGEHADFMLRPDTIVLDYGKPIKENVTSNETIDGYTLTTVGFVTYDSKADLSAIRKNLGTKTYPGKNGTFTIDGNNVVYTPKRFMTSADEVFVVVKCVKGSDIFHLYQKLTVLPATSVLYESEFAPGSIVPGGTSVRSLFFDFKNDADAILRYSAAPYGDYNYDDPNGLYLSNYGGTTFTVNNSNEGTVSFDIVRTDGDNRMCFTNTKNKYLNNNTTTADYSQYYSFRYSPSQAEKIQVRFKVTDCEPELDANGAALTPKVSLSYIPDNGTFKKVDISLGTYTVTNDKYITRTVDAPANFKNASDILGLGLNFGNIIETSGKDGKFVIDYLFIGPEEDLPTTDYLFFDFDNSVEAQERYKSVTYKGVNYDLVDAWANNNGATGITIDHAAGTMSFSNDSADKYAYFQNRTKQGVYFTPSPGSYYQVRFKLSNLGTVATGAEFKFSIQGCYVDGTWPVISDAVTNKVEDANEKYITVSGPVKSNWSTTKPTEHIYFRFEGLPNGATATIDYAYIGPETGLPNAATDYLLFGFTNSTADQNRYKAANYGNRNYDQNGKYWVTWCNNGNGNTAGASYTIDNANGLFNLKLTADKDSAGVYGATLKTTKTNGDNSGCKDSLAYVPSKDDIVQIRFKLRNAAFDKGTSSAKKPTVEVQYGIGSSAKNLGEYEFNFSNGNYITMEIPVNEEFANASAINFLALRFRHIRQVTAAGGFVDIDYIYVGPKATLPDTATDFMFFDFGDDDSDRMRYLSSSVYNGRNYDANPNPLWYTYADSKYSNLYSISNGNGTLNLDINELTETGGLWVGPSTSYGANTGRAGCFNFQPQTGDYMQIRFKLTNTKVASGGVARVRIRGYQTGVSGNTGDATANFTFANNSYITVDVPLKDTQINNGMGGFCIRLDNIISADKTKPANIEIDYIYIGSSDDYHKVLLSHMMERDQVTGTSGGSDWSVWELGNTGDGYQNDGSISADTAAKASWFKGSDGNGSKIPDNSLFFDFDNDPAAVTRYEKSQYGGVNFDTSLDNWFGAKNATVAINNTTGLMTVTRVDNRTDLTVATTVKGATAGSLTRPLSLKHGDNDYFQIRFKTTGLTPSNTTNGLSYMFWFINEDGKKADGSELVTIDDAIAATTWRHQLRSMDGHNTSGYVTLTLKMSGRSAYDAAENIQGIIFSVQGINKGTGGSISIDYMYLGPLNNGPAEREINSTGAYDVKWQGSADHLYFDFGNTTADKNRYTNAGETYGGNNFDDPAKWVKEENVTKIEQSNGNLVVTPTSGKTYAEFNTDHKLAFSTTKDNYFEMRFMLKNLTTTSGNVNVYAQGNYLGDSGWPQIINVNVPRTEVDDQYYVISGMVLDSWSKYPCADWFKLGFTNLPTDANLQIVIDYIYLGPAPQDYLYFGFGNSADDQARYTAGRYSSHNFDKNAGYWITYNSGGYTIDNATGYLKLDVANTTTGGVYGPTVKTSTAHQSSTLDTALNFTTRTVKTVLVKFKLTNCKFDKGNSSATKPTVQLEYAYNSSGIKNRTCTELAYTLVNDKEIVLEVPFDSTFANNINLRYFALRFRHLCPSDTSKAASVDIDSIYIGPGSQHSVFFGFENDSNAVGRYDTYGYGYHNFDKAGSASWYTDYNAGNTKNFTVDNVKGTLSVNLDDSAPWLLTSTGYGTSGDPRADAFRFIPKSGDYIQMRFKLNGCQPKSGATPKIDYGFYTRLASGQSRAYIRNIYYNFIEGDYIVLTTKLTDEIIDTGFIGSIGINFIGLQAAHSDATIEVDYIFMGPYAMMPNKVEPKPYGKDTTYDTDNYYSGGTAIHAYGKGRQVTTMNFSFTGTGFDIISATGQDHGSIRVTYTNTATGESKYVAVTNKSDTNLDLYQIPVATVRDLPYGTYDVEIGVNDRFIPTGTQAASLYRGNEFIFDAVRIYNPINTSAGASGTGDSKLAYNAYVVDKEACPDVAEVRDELLTSASDFATGGIGFVDYYYGSSGSATGLDDYLNIGPKNEIYLAKGQSIVFKVLVPAIPTGMDIGAKSADGQKVTMVTKIGPSSSTVTRTNTTNISTSRAMYYDVSSTGFLNNNIATAFASNEAYVTVSNTGDGILSITDIKITFSSSGQITDNTPNAFGDKVETATISLGDVVGAQADEGVVEEVPATVTEVTYVVDEETLKFAEFALAGMFPELEPVLKNGLYFENNALYYYVDDVVQAGAGLIFLNGYYYYIRSNGQAAVGTYWVTNTNGLMEPGQYTFDEDGTMFILNGIVYENGAWYYYVNNELQHGAGLIKYNGKYYYIRSSGQAAVGQYWVTNTNGLMPEGFYNFQNNGVMLLRNGIVDVDGALYYFVNDQIQYGAGLVLVNDQYYYIRSSGQAAIGQYWVTNTNGHLPEGFYTFGDDGAMVLRNGIVEENGGLYYYVNDKLVTSAGLIQLDGYYYYIRSNGQAAVGKYWVTKTNGLMDEGFYTFGEDGRMIL